MLRVAIEGASGYSGMELTRLISRHPAIELAAVSSTRWAGRSIRETLGISGAPGQPRYQRVLEGPFEAVLLATPADASLELAKRHRAQGAKVIDLSNAFRADESVVYGLTEHMRDQVRGAELVANPGCYPTATLMAVLPLIQADLVESGPILVDAKSGATGAGRKLTDTLLFNELADNHYPYRVGDHQHVPELERFLKRPVVFTPHLLPTRRGLLSAVYVRVKAEVTALDVRQALLEAYADEPLVMLVEPGPELGIGTVIRTPNCRVAAAPIIKGGFARVFGVLDNLMKGAASQALQNLNLALGLDELIGVAP